MSAVQVLLLRNTTQSHTFKPWKYVTVVFLSRPWICKEINIATDKALFSSEKCWYLIFLHENIFCGYSLGEALLMSTHNICFYWEIRKILCGYPCIILLLWFITHFILHCRQGMFLWRNKKVFIWYCLLSQELDPLIFPKTGIHGIESFLHVYQYKKKKKISFFFFFFYSYFDFWHIP